MILPSTWHTKALIDALIYLEKNTMHTYKLVSIATGKVIQTAKMTRQDAENANRYPVNPQYTWVRV